MAWELSINTSGPEYLQGGHRLARVFRQRAGLGNRPLLDFVRVLREWGVVLDQAIPTALFRTAVCAPSRGIAHLMLSSTDPRMEHLTANRFALAAALGRLLWAALLRTVTSPVGAAHGDYSRLTQSRRANAFAAELLLPSEAVRAALRPNAGADEVTDLAEMYGISRSAIKGTFTIRFSCRR